MTTPRPEMSATERVECEIDEEFAFHLARLENELRTEGLDEASARREAHARFGNDARWAEQCSRIQLKEQRMWQKINIAATVALFIAVVVLIVALINVRQHGTNEAEVLATQVRALQENLVQQQAILQQQSEARTVEQRPNPGVVYIEGLVERPGTYAMPLNSRLTVARMLAASKVLERDDLRVTVKRFEQSTGEEEIVFVSTIAELKVDPSRDMELRPDDLVQVASLAAPFSLKRQ